MLFYDQLQQLKSNKQPQGSAANASSNKKSNEAQADSNLEFVEFKDFLEPNLIKSGFLIPVTSGHNGMFSKTELTLYEMHLRNAGFIQDFLQGGANQEAELAGYPDVQVEDDRGILGSFIEQTRTEDEAQMAAYGEGFISMQPDFEQPEQDDGADLGAYPDV